MKLEFNPDLAPSRPKTAPRGPQDDPRRTQDPPPTAPRPPQNRSRPLQEAQVSHGTPRDPPRIPRGPPRDPPAGIHPGQPNSKILGPCRCDSGMSNKQINIQANMQTALSKKGRRVPRRASNFIYPVPFELFSEGVVMGGPLGPPRQHLCKSQVPPMKPKKAEEGSHGAIAVPACESNRRAPTVSMAG